MVNPLEMSLAQEIVIGAGSGYFSGRVLDAVPRLSATMRTAASIAVPLLFLEQGLEHSQPTLVVLGLSYAIGALANRTNFLED